MPRHHFSLAPASQQPRPVRVWFDVYWGRLHWVARWHTADGARSLRGSFITSLPSNFLGLLRGLVEDDVRATLLAAPAVSAPKPAPTSRPVLTRVVPWTIKRTLAHPPMPPAAPHGSWWPAKGRQELRP